jgi:anti-sigma regulatory factor (Ser/Thr protein kinase)
MRKFVEATVAGFGADEALVYDAALAADEAVCNIIVHGYQRVGGQVELCVARAGGDLVIRIRDWAPAFDPTAHPAPDLAASLEQRRPGGLGIYLIRRVMDEMNYRRLAEGGNELLLVRRTAFCSATE